MEHVVITISRQYGSGGKTIAAMLAKKLGINVYSRDILRMASEDSGINEKLFGMSDEKIRHAGWFHTLSHPYDGGLIPPEDKEFVSDDNLFNYQAKIIRELAEKESCIIVGRCADYILRDMPNVLSVFIHADKEFCLERSMERNSMTEKEMHSYRLTSMVEPSDKMLDAIMSGVAVMARQSTENAHKELVRRFDALKREIKVYQESLRKHA